MIISKGFSTKNCKFHYPLDMGFFVLGRGHIYHKVKLRDYFNKSSLLKSGCQANKYIVEVSWVGYTKFKYPDPEAYIVEMYNFLIFIHSATKSGQNVYINIYDQRALLYKIWIFISLTLNSLTLTADVLEHRMVT